MPGYSASVASRTRMNPSKSVGPTQIPSTFTRRQEGAVPNVAILRQNVRAGRARGEEAMNPAGATLPLDCDQLLSWKGRQEIADDTITAPPMAALGATLDRDDPPPRLGDPLPPLRHWLYFLPLPQHTPNGPDGHARRCG